MSTPSSLESSLDRLASQRLVVVTGKGGVGKTTTAVLLSRLIAARGRRVLCLEIDPRENAHRMLGAAPSGGQVTPVGSGVYLQNLPARRVLDQVVREQVRIGFVAKRVLGSPIYEQFAGGCPGLEELAVLGYALRIARGLEPEAKGIETVVLDAPATGHGVSLLTAPHVVAGVIEGGPIGYLAGELATFMGDPEQSGVVVTTTAEEMPIQESIELLTLLLERFGRGPELVVVNRLYPDVPADVVSSEEPAHRLWRRRVEVNEREAARLREAWDGPVLRLPLSPFTEEPFLLARLVDVAGRGGRS